MYKVFDKYPDAIARSLPRLRERLEDSDPSSFTLPYTVIAFGANLVYGGLGVVSATVNILCELARRNPRDYLPLAPQLFELLTTSSNNWMLIKLIKLVSTSP